MQKKETKCALAKRDKVLCTVPLTTSFSILLRCSAGVVRTTCTCLDQSLYLGVFVK